MEKSKSIKAANEKWQKLKRKTKQKKKSQLFFFFFFFDTNHRPWASIQRGLQPLTSALAQHNWPHRRWPSHRPWPQHGVAL